MRGLKSSLINNSVQEHVNCLVNYTLFFHYHHHIHEGLDQFDPFRLQSYNCSRQCFFGLRVVFLHCGL